MTISDVRERLAELKEDDYVDVEVYRYATPGYHDLYPHTDFIKFVEDYDDTAELYTDTSYWVMDEEEYDNSIHANTDHADFEMWYNDKNVKVLVIMIK